ncbi:alpha/beta-hydrolase [Gloeophyllum trabeum ATCC 11539]|uniref:Alpha/beta-hydrolase n=1 Tax=Gloeophyllum trabeum (strain ATCC 11539 / FP-39264 / Madison 617) TaxID=670483 RepID=S7RU59_GLOTA|nr:alpha/beta-hydrolase [Gloeophyllum trabeum ATCC 11539]EPQ58255.1 alpha/beta-hydrolase [Gloeophyllum trabeum ATCC 11539]
MADGPSLDPGHPFSATSHISFNYHRQTISAAPFGYDYFLSLPPAYASSPARTWPLILFLHGAGESQRGLNESYASLRHGIPKLVLCYDKWKAGCPSPAIHIPKATRFSSRRPIPDPADLSAHPVPPAACTLAAEQFITASPSLDMLHGYGWNPAVLSSLLDELLLTYAVDPDRVHVTGFSMGGYGTWALALRAPHRFASLAPICGGADPALAKSIAHVPHWIHHGESDPIIPIEESVEMHRALRDAGADEVHFTRYPDTEHDSWTYAYNNPDLFRWMLEKTRPATNISQTPYP